MAKNFFQDVVPPSQRSIRNVPIMGSRRHREAPPPSNEHTGDEYIEKEEPVESYYPTPAFPKEKKRLFSVKVFVILVVILVAGFIFGMMTVFTSAKITIVPKQESVSINTALKAQKSALSPESLIFEVIEIKKEGQIEMVTDGEEIAEKKASGTIVVYNDFSAETQRLITRTRFQTKEGLVYRIAESITVPGKTATGPGLVEAKVFADEAGEKYNIGKTDFTLPGFKSDQPRYKGFYAKSKTDMTGGFVGKLKKVNQSDRDAALKNLEESLKQDLNKEVGTKVQNTFTPLNGSTIYEFKDLGQTESSSAMALLKLEATAKVVIFDKHSLASVIAKQFLPVWADIPVEIRDFNGMAVVFDPGFNLSADTISLKLSGTASVFAAVNGIEVADNLKGAPKGDLNIIMSEFKGVSSATASIRPLWKSSFPSDSSKIHIIVE